MCLFHVSEVAGIAAFYPRQALEAWPDLAGHFVWAIAEEMLPNYLLPRTCPRICLRSTESSEWTDIEQLMAGDAAPLILLEERWKPIVESATLFVYEFNPAPFRLLDEAAGYWVAEELQRPIRTIIVDNIPEHLVELRIRVEYREEIASLAAAVAASSLRYSMIKMGNARAST